MSLTSKNSNFKKCITIIDLLVKMDQSDSIVGLDHYQTISNRKILSLRAHESPQHRIYYTFSIDFGKFQGKYDDFENSKSKNYFFGEKKITPTKKV